MAILTSNRAAVSLSPELRDRVTLGAKANGQTIEAFLRSVLDEHESHKFWDAVDQVRVDPGYPELESDFTAEDALIAASE